MEIPYVVHARPDTGLYNAKVGIWLFLASEVMLFGGLFSSYVILRIGAPVGTWPHGLLNIPIGTVNTLVLIISSITVVMAWASLKMKQFGRFKFFQACTILLAMTFVLIKSFEYRDKWHHYDIRFANVEAANKIFEEAYGKDYLEAAKAIYHNRYGVHTPFNGILGVPFTGHIEKRHVAVPGKEPIDEEGNPYFWTTAKLKNPQGPVEYLEFIPDGVPHVPHATPTATEASAPHAEHGAHVKIETSEIQRLSAYLPEHSTYFSIYFTLTALHALHVIAGAIVIAYLWGPGSKMWKTDPERFTNRIEVSGLFWHFVDLVWIFLFPVLYLL